jgi:hypothetical protein
MHVREHLSNNCTSAVCHACLIQFCGPNLCLYYTTLMYFDRDKFPEERFLLFTIITNRLQSRVLAFATIQKFYVLYVYTLCAVTCVCPHIFVQERTVAR